MKTINEVHLLGHVTSEIKTSTLPNGTQFSQLTLKTREFFKTGGETKKEINYHSLIAWNGISKSIEEVLNKNELIWVRGRMKTHKVTPENGKPYSKVEIVIEEWSKISYTDVEGFDPEAKFEETED